MIEIPVINPKNILSICKKQILHLKIIKKNDIDYVEECLKRNTFATNKILIQINTLSIDWH